MKRWLAALLAATLLLSALPGLAENGPEVDTVGIEESVVSPQGDDAGDAENREILLSLLQDEEIKSLLKNDELRDVLSEITWDVLVWLFQNRPVTMKILKELGFSEQEVGCVAKLWDSAERISAILDNFKESESSRQLDADFEALIHDPDIRESAVNFRRMATSGQITLLLEALTYSLEDKPVGEYSGLLTDEALRRKLDTATFTGKLILQLLHIVEESDWARESLPKLRDNENLWRFLIDVAKFNPELDRQLLQEISLVTGDPELFDFLKKAVSQIVILHRYLSDGPDTKPQAE